MLKFCPNFAQIFLRILLGLKKRTFLAPNCSRIWPLAQNFQLSVEFAQILLKFCSNLARGLAQILLKFCSPVLLKSCSGATFCSAQNYANLAQICSNFAQLSVYLLKFCSNFAQILLKSCSNFARAQILSNSRSNLLKCCSNSAQILLKSCSGP